MTAAEIEVAVAKHIGIRRNLIVPNVWWGMGLSFECDMFYVTGSGYAHEIEIKVSKSDLARDKKKRRHYWKRPYQGILRSRTFAIPSDMVTCADNIPETCGIILVSPNHRCRVLRKPKLDTAARKLTDKEIMHLGRLAAMRIWAMKGKLLKGKP